MSTSKIPPIRYPLRAIDLFCGAGGLTEGFKLAGFEVTFALDKDKDSYETYRLNHPGVRVECASITDYSPAEIASMAGGRVDVVIGGPSCQGFSTAGRRNGWVKPEDERNSLWEHMLAVVAELKPRAFMMENVPGMVYWKAGHFGAKILDAFKDLGYSVTKDILLAADYGVPQRRRRLFIVGLLGDKEFEFPKPTNMGGWRRDTLHLWEEKRLKEKLERHLTVWDAIGDLPPIGTGPGGPVTNYIEGRSTPFARAMRGDETELRDHEVSVLGADHMALIHHVPQGGTWRDIPPHLLPERFMGGMRRTDSTNLIGRLDPALPSYTINTQFGNVTSGCFTHPYEDRSLSIREGARLQTFPDRYRFIGGLSSRARQIGNAVPPLLGSILASAIAQAVGGPKARVVHKRPDAPKPGKSLPAPHPTDEATRARMQRQDRRDTLPEMRIRMGLEARGLEFEVDAKPEPGLRRTADILFGKEKVAVFVDGCFWHGCPQHARNTKSNTKWWADKIDKNRRRDAHTRETLEAAGWRVIRVWEHEEPGEAVERIAAEVLSRRNQGELLAAAG
ncbi:DNA mismatch endonuclease Vsr [Micromonospora halotolerans]|uniref:DNA (cytosine-5-)-methyltransferase n=1 Tax=Micromonospora halotolerans TaxID=709879 RepID=A0ABZ0A2L2_9ACTN|nr:DNA mismatch endonuclease Vsr [Micromonospora halotolerans]WNM41688.1 DNA mismatch endonuclease Vsr [Micromonospora halotolerans]